MLGQGATIKSPEISSNEQDLLAAQQMKSQTRLRVEVSIECACHLDAVAGLDAKAGGMDEAKALATKRIEEKRAEITAKKAELGGVWRECAVPDEPRRRASGKS